MTLWTMNVNDVMWPGQCVSVRRVPGGWIYAHYSKSNYGKPDAIATTFVPYSEEGKPKK